MKPQPEHILLEAYEAHADAILRFCWAQTGERDAAHDLTQEVFVRTWQYLAKGKAITKIRPFLYQAARNAIIDRSRRARTASLDAMRDDGFDLADRGPDSAVLAEASRAVLAIARLESQYREAVALRYLDDLSPKQIGDILGLSENAASVRIHRGLEQLRKLINP